MLESLKVALLGSQIDFISLDNFMQNNGFYSIADAGVMENIKNDKNIYYISKDDQNNVLITFDLLSNNYYDDSNNFYLEIIGIELA